GMRSASKSTMRVQQTRRTIPSAPASSITKRSRSWSSEYSRSSRSGSASRHMSFRSGRCFSPPSRVCSIETTRSRNIRVWAITVSSDRQPRILEDLPRDDQPVDLARALVDLGDPRVAKVALDRVLLGVAVAAVDLERLGRDALGHLGGEEL